MNRTHEAYKKFYTVALNSDDAAVVANGDYQFVVNLPITHLSPTATIAVSSFFTSVSLSANFYRVHVRELAQPLSFWSRAKGSTDRVLTLTGQSFMQEDLTLETGLSAFGFGGVGKQLTVHFTDLHGAAIVPSLAGGSFELTLVIFDTEPTAAGRNIGKHPAAESAARPTHMAGGSYDPR
jgi:hemolysin activation/secretion protein